MPAPAEQITETQWQPPAEGEDSQEWSVVCLQAEDPIKREYLVQWQDIDPDTGFQYPPSWEPKEACTQDLIDEWKGKLARGEVRKGRQFGQAIITEFNKRQKEELKHRKNAISGKRKGRTSGASTINAGRSETPREREEEDVMEELDDEEEGGEESEEWVKRKSTRNGVDKGKGKGNGTERSLRSRDNSAASTVSPAGGKRKRGKVIDEQDESYGQRLKRTRGKASATREMSEASEAVSTSSSTLQERPDRSSKTPSVANTAGQTPISARVRNRSASVTAAASADMAKRTAPAASGSRKDSTNGATQPASAKASGSTDTVFPPRAPTTKKTAHVESEEPSADGGVQSVLPLPSAPARAGRYGVPVIDLSTSVPSRAGPSSKPANKSATTTIKKLGIVPRPDEGTLQQAKSKQQEATQSTATQDTIKQFSSPLRPEGSGEQRKDRQKMVEEAVAKEYARVEKEKRKGKGKAKVKKMMIDGVEVLVAPDTDEEEEEEGEADAENAGWSETRTSVGTEAEAVPESRVVKRIIDGEGVLAAEDSDDEEIPAEIAAVEAEIAPVAANVPVPVIMVDQSIQVEMTEMTTAATMTDAPPAVPAPAKMVDMAIETAVATVMQQVDAEVPNVVLDIPPVPTSTGETSSGVDAQLLLDLQVQLATAEAEMADLRSRNASLSTDLSFIRAQYDNASSRAVEEVNLNRELTKKLKVKEQQLTVGLRQKELHIAAIQKKDRDHIRAQGIQIKVLLDQARKTDDALRTKAALYPQTKRENEDLVQSNAILERRVEALVNRNEELVDQVEILRAKQMGVLDEQESDSASETDTDSTSSDDDENGQDMARLGYSTRPANMTSSGNIFPTPTRAAGEPRGGLEYDVKREEIGMETSAQGLAVECQWREEDEDKPCGALLESRSALQQHWNIHRANVRPMPI